jgi:hypothetical protein
MDDAVNGIVASILSEAGCAIRPEAGPVLPPNSDQVALEAAFVAQLEAIAAPAAGTDAPLAPAEKSEPEPEPAAEEQEDMGDACALLHVDVRPDMEIDPRLVIDGDETAGPETSSPSPVSSSFPPPSSGPPPTNRQVDPDRGVEVAFASSDETRDDPARQGQDSARSEPPGDDDPVPASSDTKSEPKRDMPLVPERRAPDPDPAVQPQNERVERRESEVPSRPAAPAHGASWNMPHAIRQSPDMVITRKDDVIELRLTPEELGSLRILVANRDQVQHVTFLLERPEVLDQFRRHADLMTRQLSEAGIEGSTLEFRQDRGQDQQLSDPRQPRDRPGPSAETPGQPLALAIPASTQPGVNDTRLDLRI